MLIFLLSECKTQIQLKHSKVTQVLNWKTNISTKAYLRKNNYYQTKST